MNNKWKVFAMIFIVAVVGQALLPHIGTIMVLGVFGFGLTIIIPLYLNFLKAAIKLYAAILVLMVCLYMVQMMASALSR